MSGLRTGWAEGALRRIARQAQGGLLEALADKTHDAVFVVDSERNLVAYNDRAEALTGISREEVLGRSCLTGFRCGTCLESCGIFERGDFSDVPVEIHQADGRRLPVLKSAAAIHDRTGKVIGAVETFRPLDEQGTARGTVEASWSGMQSLMDSLGRAVLVVDEQFAVQRCSRLLGELVGRPAKELVGHSASEILGEGLFGQAAYFRSALLSGERREGWRADLRGSNGRVRPVSVTGAVLEANAGCGLSASSRRYVIVVRPEAPIDLADAVDDSNGPVVFEGMVARSPAMRRVFHLIDHLRDSDATVLVTGESGTGKELVARAIHARSTHAGRPFVAVNCGALPENLLETELFGHARGAFTGAVRDKPGRFEVAADGTVFLDEIGDLPLSLQVKLLRVLQERSFERVGETVSRPFRARVIAATHQDLPGAVAEKRFREDLFYRLDVVPIMLPPLRERREDLELLILHLLGRVGQRHRALRLSPSAMRVLLSYAWPGNVRQLENALEYATAVCEGQTIHPEDLPPEIRGERTSLGPGAPPPRGHPRAASLPKSPPVPRVARPASSPDPATLLDPWPDRQSILAALGTTHHRRGAAAKLLGVSRTTLWRRMKDLRLE